MEVEQDLAVAHSGHVKENAVTGRAKTIHVVDPEEAERRAKTKEARKEYGRGKSIPYKSAKDKKLRTNLKRIEEKYTDAAVRAKDAEILLEHDSGLLEAEHELERTYKVRQDEIIANVGTQTARSRFDLSLDFGPYLADYTRNGRGLLLGGRKGHVASMDWRAPKPPIPEIHLKETVRDLKWTHNDQYYAVAQKKYVYIYDHQGVELHCLNKHIEVTMMTFLPYHFLLATIGNAGYLKYQDTSTGQLVAEMPTKSKLGSATALALNPWNAIMHVGHSSGQVSLWSPNSTTPLVKTLPHPGPVRSVAIDREGRYMVSTGQDRKMSIWDIRTYKTLNSYELRQPGASVAVSDRGLTAVGWGTKVDIWQGLFDQERAQSPYMSWGGEGKRIERVQWCPFEDVLGVSHDKGFSSIIIPGAGEANFDALAVNPYETTKQRQESEVKMLLDKLQPETINLNPNTIGSLDTVSHEQRQKEKDLDRAPEDEVAQLKNRGRGKNSSLRKHLRKKGSKNIVDERRMRIDKLRKDTNAALRKKQKKREEELGPALSRFAKRST